MTKAEKSVKKTEKLLRYAEFVIAQAERDIREDAKRGEEV